MTGNEPAERWDERRQTPADEGTIPAGPEDVRGFSLDDDEAGDEPLPSPVPQLPPTLGFPTVTGWPDPTPPVIDPATQAAWQRLQPENPNAPERP